MYSEVPRMLLENAAKIRTIMINGNLRASLSSFKHLRLMMPFSSNRTLFNDTIHITSCSSFQMRRVCNH